jgi:hypothetical protein
LFVVQNGRYYVALSLNEAEHMRGLIHARAAGVSVCWMHYYLRKHTHTQSRHYRRNRLRPRCRTHRRWRHGLSPSQKLTHLLPRHCGIASCVWGRL